MEPLRLAPVPPNPGPRDEVRRIAGGDDSHFCIISPQIWGVWTHWDNGRTRPCHAEKKQCQGCQLELPARWKGYIHCIDTSKRTDCFLELTPLVAQLLLTGAPKNEPLRGLHIGVSRGKGNKARLRLVVQVGRVIEAQLPPAKDPSPVLIALWQMPDRRKNSLADPQSRFSRVDSPPEQSYN